MKKAMSVWTVLAVFVLGTLCAAAAEPAFRIGITQVASYPALDAARKGFIDYLKDHGYRAGEKVRFDIKYAKGDRRTSKRIAQEFVKGKVDLIFAISTGSTQDAAAATADIPIIFAAVTDPVSAGVVKSLEHPGRNVSGVTDRSPSGKQLDLIKEIVPGARSVGIVYNPKDVSSQVLVKDLKSEAAKRRLQVVEAYAESSDQAASAAKKLVGKVDVILAPADITVVQAIPSIAKVCEAGKIPLFAAVIEAVSKGAVAATALDYYQLGRQAGAMALQVLQGKAKISKLPVQAGEKTMLVLNPGEAKKIGLKLPDSILKQASKIVK
jgi:putative ABC transport system substrate-binding protein